MGVELQVALGYSTARKVPVTGVELQVALGCSTARGRKSKMPLLLQCFDPGKGRGDILV